MYNFEVECLNYLKYTNKLFLSGEMLVFSKKNYSLISVLHALFSLALSNICELLIFSTPNNSEDG